MNDTEIRSLREWLEHWGEGNWSDATGQSVPIARVTLARLLDATEKARAALRELKARALNRAPGARREFAPSTAATIAIICEDALDDVEMAVMIDPASKIKISLDDPETRATWQAAQDAKAEVASWPAWKRGGPVVEAACAPPEGQCWCSACEDDRLASLSPMEALINRRFIICPKCGNKRCPKATHHGYRCTNSNESDQVCVEEAIESATHALLDRVAGGATFVRRVSSTQTAECPLWSSMEGQYIETDEQLRARLTSHVDRGDGFTHHDEDDCATFTPASREHMRVAPNWADAHIAALRRGESVTFHPCGKSMEPLVMHGQRVTVEPYGEDGWMKGYPFAPRVGDIVLVTVGTRNPFTGEVTPRQYLHKIVEIIPATPVGLGGDPAEYVIGNNRGKINGRVWRGDIHGRMVR